MSISSMKYFTRSVFVVLAFLLTPLGHAADAYLEITLNIDDKDRAGAAGIYKKYKQPFLESIPGATSKELLIRDKDVQVLHGFTSVKKAEAYLQSPLFNKDVVSGLTPFLKADPEIRIYQSM